MPLLPFACEEAMQTTEHDEKQLPSATPDPQSQPLQPVPIAQVSEKDDDPDEIFFDAVAEIDTQPLVQVKRKRAKTTLTIGDVLEIMFLIGWACFTLIGSMYLAATVPHTLVILYAKTIPAQITAPLAVPTRKLAPVTVTRSTTAPTTGIGHQSARAATGTLTFYNGSYVSQTMNAGTVYTGRNGIQVMLLQTVSIPAASPPQFGEANATAQAVNVGAEGNIAAYDITLVLSNFLTVKNLAAFTGGRDERTYQAVAQHDLDSLTANTLQRVNQSLPQAFTLRSGETLQVTTCSVQTTADHGIGQETQTLTVKIMKTCSAFTYNRQQEEKQATAAFTQTKPAANYHVVGSIAASLQSVSPFTVTVSGKWTFTFSPDYEQSLAEKIAGATSAQARKLLLQTGVIADASIPGKLPPAGSLIDLLVLVG